MDGSPAGPLLFNASLFSELKRVPSHRREALALRPHHKSSLDCRGIMGLQCFNISNEYSGLISFRMDWSDLLAVQGTLKSLLQHHSSKASVLRRSASLVS